MAERTVEPLGSAVSGAQSLSERFPDHSRAEKICYSTGPTITGPRTYRGIVADSAFNSFTIQNCIMDFKGQAHFFYHNGALPNGGGSFHRSVCLDYLYYNSDGSIQPIVQAKEGVRAPPIKH